MAEIRLYSANVCPFAQRTRLALAEKGLEFDLTEIDLDNKPRWFLDLTPYGKVPVLRRGEDLVFESTIVNEYLEEVYPEPPLLPREPGRRATVRLWIDFANTKFLDAFYHLLVAQDEGRREGYAEELRARLRFMEEGLATTGDGGPYWMGKDVTLVDLSVYPFLERFGMLAHYRGFRLPDLCRRLRTWAGAMEERPAVRAIANPTAYYVEAYRGYAEGTATGTSYRGRTKEIAAAEG